jgi:hypothetical protein
LPTACTWPQRPIRDKKKFGPETTHSAYTWPEK